MREKISDALAVLGAACITAGTALLLGAGAALVCGGLLAVAAAWLMARGEDG